MLNLRATYSYEDDGSELEIYCTGERDAENQLNELVKDTSKWKIMEVINCDKKHDNKKAGWKKNDKVH